MININELMIGNIIGHTKNGGKVTEKATVERISLENNFISVRFGDGVVTHDYAKMFVPLMPTEKILKDTGFILGAEAEGLRNKMLVHGKEKSFQVLFNGDDLLQMIVNNRLVKLEYVHTLQNIFFIHTKKKLKIKL